LALAFAKPPPCHKQGPRDHEKPGEPIEMLSMDALPDAWSWDDVNGTDWLTLTR